MGGTISQINSKKKIIIAGYNGLIGTFLSDSLKKDYKIITLDNKRRSTVNFSTRIDLNLRADIESIIKKVPVCDALIFLVGLAHKKGQRKDLDQFRKINKKTLVSLLSALDINNKLPKKIIFASTISVYGEKIDQDIYLEDSLAEPSSPYAITKLEAEEYLLSSFSKQSWLLRFAPVYGKDFWLNIRRRTKLAGQYFKVGEGTAKLSLCHIENILLVVQEIIENRIPADVYNISDDKEYSYNDLLKYVQARKIIRIPLIIVKGIYLLGKIFNNIFLKENTIKLISDNIYPSNKIRKYLNFTYNITKINNKK